MISHRAAVLGDGSQPPPITIDPTGIPGGMKSLRRWVCWCWEWKGKKWNKPPCSPTGGVASSTDETTWTTFQVALRGHEKRGLGIGFVLNGDGIVGIDLDDCRDPQTGVIAGWAQDIIDRLATYCEISPSGTGVKLLIRGTLPDGLRKQFSRPDGDGEVEVYSTARYWTITGQKLSGSPGEIRENQSGLNAVVGMLQSWRVETTTPQGNLAAYGIDASEPQTVANPTDDRTTALAALAVLNADCRYDDWLRIGQALHAVDSSAAMLAEWDRWSRESDKYIEGEPAWKWKTFHADGGVGLGTLCKLADDTGRSWRPKRDAKSKDTDPRHRQKCEATAENGACVTIAPVEPFEPFPLEALPQPVRGFVQAGAKAIGCDPSFLAVPMMVVCAAAIGNARRVRLKHSWSEPAILWAALVAFSGDHKSPALETALKAIRERQKRAIKAYEAEFTKWENESAQYEKDFAAWKRSKGTGDPPERPAEPIAWRILVDDTTIEALAGLLKRQPRGLFLACDELAGWLGGFERYKSKGAGSDCAKWLEVHGGRMLLIDRKTGQPKTLCIPNASVSVIGGIQPEILKRCLTVEHRANGLSARLLVTMPPRRAKRWNDATIHPDAEKAIGDMIDRLLSLEMITDPEDDDPRPQLIDLDADAKAIFVKFYNEHAEEQSAMTGELCAAWSKLEAYAPRLALIYHLIRWANGEIPSDHEALIDAESMSAGITLVRWFAHEARRVHGMLNETRKQGQQRELIDWIRRRGGRVSVRELQRWQWKYRGSADQARTDLDALGKLGAGRWETSDTGGHPLEEFVLYDQGHRQKPNFPPENSPCVNVDAVNVSKLRLGERYFQDEETDAIHFPADDDQSAQ